MRFVPKSLSGQLALVMTAALLVASVVNFAILYGERSRAGVIEATGPAISRFAELASNLIENPPQQDAQILPLGPRQGGARFALTERDLIERRGVPRNARLEARLKRALSEAGVEASEVRAATRMLDRPDGGRIIPGGFGGMRGFRRDGTPGPFPPGLPPPAFRDGSPREPRVVVPLPPQPPTPPDERTVREYVLAAQLPDSRWLTASIVSPEIPRGEIVRLGASTFILFVCVLGAALLVTNRLSKPLQDLSHAASRVGAASEPEEVAVRGPADVRQTLEAFNAMSRRVSQLLGEKDVMLGALGHDLRTPLTSLRIRLETMEPEAERQKAIRTIEETSQLLEDILELARQGRSGEPVQTMDAAVLIEDLAEDYAETGAPVTMGGKARAPIAVRPVLFRRMMRNLIDNALAYGKTGALSVAAEDGAAVIRLADEGPGIPEDQLAFATRPFVRGEDSRSRRTGGSGLGLALADAIAKAHGGDLRLENRQPGGLLVTIRIPLAAV